MGISGNIIEPGHQQSLPSARNSATPCLPKVFSSTEVRGLSASDTAVGQAYQIKCKADFERNRCTGDLKQLWQVHGNVDCGHSHHKHDNAYKSVMRQLVTMLLVYPGQEIAEEKENE
jgi:hypothetical protein